MVKFWECTDCRKCRHDSDTLLQSQKCKHWSKCTHFWDFSCKIANYLILNTLHMPVKALFSPSGEVKS